MANPHHLRQEWRRGWTMVLASSVGVAVSVSHIYGIGALLASIEQSFNWSRMSATSGVTVVSLCAAVAGPVVGLALDRLGPRRIALAGLVVYCSGFMLLSLASGSYLLWLLHWFMISLGYICIGPSTWTTGIVSRFDVGRGGALALTLCGTGIGSAILPVAGNYLAETYGWRTAVLGFGMVELIIAMPLAFLFFFGASDQMRLASGGKQRVRLMGVAGPKAIFSVHFIKLAVASFAFIAAIIGTVIHFVPILEWGGLPRSQAASITGAIGLAMIAGRAVTGFVIDRIRADRVGAIVFLVPVVAWTGILTGQFSGYGPILMAISIGFATGAEVDVIAYLIARFFGLRNFGLLFGTIGSVINLAIAAGPATASLMFDRYHTYTYVGWLYVGLLLAGAVLLLSLGPYPTSAQMSRASAHSGDKEQTRTSD